MDFITEEPLKKELNENPWKKLQYAYRLTNKPLQGTLDAKQAKTSVRRFVKFAPSALKG